VPSLPDNSVSPPAAAGSANDLLVVEHLDVRHGAVQVLWDISLSVAEHKVTCIIGANGAGKTSTLNAIAGVLRAKSGRILLAGKDITALPGYERVKCQISLVPEGRQLWPGMSVEDNLLMGCYPQTLRSHARANLARIYDLFPRLKERHRQMAGTLSGGEQQMCAIGRGLMSEPKLLMLDEPSLGLAPILVDEVFELIRNIGKQGVTILLVGQNVNYTLQVSHYGYVMEVGRITLHGPSEMLANNQHVREAYLGGTVAETEDSGSR
jgi:branched-chain amino acid transport system ATP-binding protein